jgi:N-acetylglucosamine-6-sulfatase
MRQTGVVAVALLVGLLIWAGLRFVVGDQDRNSFGQGAGSGPNLPGRQDRSSPDQATDPRLPNILFILTDDMRASDLKYMPKTQSLLEKQGVKFTEAFVTRSHCCPSRATILRGQYAHNHNVWTDVPPAGSFWKFYDQGLENSTIATWLDGAGYNTILIGKYLNYYGSNPSGSYAPTTYVPPGWDQWYGWEGSYIDADAEYDINENGQVVTYDRSDIHETDLYARTAERFIRQTAGRTPFFMYLSTNTPHFPAYYAPRRAGMFSDEQLPRPPSFDEGDVSDKPAWVRNKPLVTSTQISDMTQLYRNRLRALQSVDDMVGRLVAALRNTGELSNTYLVFTSDNGIHLGEHRLQGKVTAYDEAVHVPLLVRGPSVPQEATRSQMVLNNDLAPTFADLTSAKVPAFVDGRSLKPLLSVNPPSSWRSAFLIEHRRSTENGGVRAIPAQEIPNYDAVRTSRYLYVEYSTTGEKELYDLRADPFALTNLYASASPTLLSDLQSTLDKLESCAGETCKTAENGV